MPKTQRYCRQCKILKSLKDFPLPRHRICTECQERRKHPDVPDVSAAAAAGERARVARQSRELTGYQQAQAFINAAHNMNPNVPLTMSWAGNNKYQRERKRELVAVRRKAQADYRRDKGLPDPKPAEFKYCRHCKTVKAAGRFRNQWVRICMECDGPAIIPSPFTSSTKE